MGICYPMHTTEIPILTSWSDIYVYNIIIIIDCVHKKMENQFLHKDHLVV